MATPIKVVLQQDVESVGLGGDVIRVRPGFARNFLIPRGLAVVASSANLALLEELKKAALAAAARRLAEAKQAATGIETVSVKIERSVGDEGRMYGSVTARDIEEAFAAAGQTIDRKKIVLPEPIKQLGVTTVPLKLHAAVTAQLKVEVVKKA
ncbi:MAG TPA: 50S ribosomal protein L9 [Polyangiaceae bacterium]|nr:50S ribosomal protein L9 [Polyangiaceae bacterium]